MRRRLAVDALRFQASAIKARLECEILELLVRE